MKLALAYIFVVGHCQPMSTLHLLDIIHVVSVPTHTFPIFIAHFLLRAKVLVNGESATITSMMEGSILALRIFQRHCLLPIDGSLSLAHAESATWLTSPLRCW